MPPQKWNEYDPPRLLLSCRIRYGHGFSGVVDLPASGLSANERKAMEAFIQVIVERANLYPSITFWGDVYKRDDKATTLDKKE
jgi:hypothetical protein